MKRRWKTFPLLNFWFRQSLINQKPKGGDLNYRRPSLKLKTMITFIIGFVVGAYIDNRFAPKIRIVDGKVTLTWADKNKK